MAIDQTKTIFSTRYNFLKIFVNDNTTILVADSFNPITFEDDVATYLLYAHNLGYIPRARVSYEPVNGQLWPMTGTEQFSNSNGGSGTELEVFGTYHLTTTGLYVDMLNVSGSAKNIPFYYRIYLDE